MDIGKLGLYLGMFAVTAVFTSVGVYGSNYAASLMLLAGAMHLCGDGLPYIADFCNEYFNVRKSRARLLKLTIVLSNSMFLFGTTGYILWEAYDRFKSPYVVHGWGVFFFALGEVAGNFLQMAIEHKLEHLRTNDPHGHIHHSQWDHLVGDVAASGLQVTGALAILTLGLLWIDPVASALGAVLTGYLSIKGLRKFFALLESDEKEHGHSHAGHH